MSTPSANFAQMLANMNDPQSIALAQAFNQSKTPQQKLRDAEAELQRQRDVASGMFGFISDDDSDDDSDDGQ